MKRLALALLLLCAPARADSTWYGWQSFIVDGVALAAMSTWNEGAVQAGALLYVFGPPIVHTANGEAGRAVASLGLRLALPYGGAMATRSVDGMFLGCLVAIGIDDLALARTAVGEHIGVEPIPRGGALLAFRGRFLPRTAARPRARSRPRGAVRLG